MMEQMILLLIILLLIAILAGFVIGFLGIGAGMVLVPSLSIIFRLYGGSALVDMHVAVGTALALIAVSSGRAVIAHDRRGALDRALVLRWLPYLFVGIIVGAVISRVVSSLTLSMAFLLLILFALGISSLSDETFKKRSLPPFVKRHIYSLALFVGGYATLLGIGGGVMTVPLFRLAHVPFKKAIPIGSATAFCVGTIGFITAVVNGWSVVDLPPYSLGYFNLMAFFLIAPIMILVVPVGVHCAHRMDHTVLRRYYMGFLCMMMMVMLIKVFWL
jgi:uncharacterized protein